MPLQCPECESARLQIEHALELGADERSDEVTLQIVHCAACDMEAVAVYEEARRGALEDESTLHSAFPTDEEALGELMDIFASCRDPQDPECRCRGHQRAREMLSDRMELLGIDWDDPMPIIFVEEVREKPDERPYPDGTDIGGSDRAGGNRGGGLADLAARILADDTPDGDDED
jgi:hypothetical protein